jgi:hypothetical protein
MVFEVRWLQDSEQKWPAKGNLLESGTQYSPPNAGSTWARYSSRNVRPKGVAQNGISLSCASKISARHSRYRFAETSENHFSPWLLLAWA